jgi:hypothetical protein
VSPPGSTLVRIILPKDSTRKAQVQAMFDTSERFITQMNFVSCASSEALRDAYHRLQQNGAETPAARLRQLYSGLSDLKFANQPLHGIADNLDVLLYEAEEAKSNSNTIAFWIQQLEREIRIGQQRAEFVYLFGSLLEEWGLRESADNLEEPDSVDKREQIDRLTSPANLSGYEAVLAPLLEKLGRLDDKAHKQISESVNYPVNAAKSVELKHILTHLRNNQYHTSALRSEARRYLQSDDLTRELGDALTIMIAHLNEWSWPAEGVASRMVDNYGKERLFLVEGLPTACLLALVARRLHAAFKGFSSAQRANRLARLNRLLELGAPDVIIANERRMLQETSGLGLPRAADIWAEATSTQDGAESAGETFISGSIVGQRSTITAKLRDVAEFERYGSQGGSSRMSMSLAFINAEIQLGRAAFPDRPLHVINIELKQFYASIQHEVLRYILTQLNFPETELRFIERFLKIPLKTDGSVVTAQRGIPHNEMLSDYLAELLMLLLEHHVLATAPVQIVRLIDDICIITPSAEHALKAWRAVGAFCDACGLAVNPEKCGSVTINGERPAGLPTALPGWISLRLNERGEWLVDDEKFENFLRYAREEIAAKTTVLSRVERYNAAAEHIAAELGISAPLGETHRASINRALMRFHNRLFGDDQSITGHLSQLIRERFLGGNKALVIPDAWLYWPITAGGLGLRHMAVLVSSYAEADRDRTRPAIPLARPSDWQRRINDWTNFYRFFNMLLERPAAPANNQVMEALVKEFIARGSTISGGKQKTLSTYWRWVLYTYGPQILDYFGTFGFLITELVPLQLISQRRIGEAGEEGE